MSASNAVLDLIERFDRNLDDYRSGRYNETQVRLEFIDPFFKALGWDIYNEQGHAEAEEVDLMTSFIYLIRALL